MHMTPLQQVYLGLACAALLALAMIAAQVLCRTGSVSVSSRSSFVMAAAIVLSVRAASFYMAMGTQETASYNDGGISGRERPPDTGGVVDAALRGAAETLPETARLLGGDGQETPDIGSSHEPTGAAFAAEWSLVLNLDWGGVCFLAACMTHMSALLRSALAARTLDRYGVLKRVFQNQNNLRRPSSMGSEGGKGAPGDRRSLNAGGAHPGAPQRTSSGGYMLGPSLDGAGQPRRRPRTSPTAAAGAPAPRASARRLAAQATSSRELPVGGAGNPYRQRRSEVRDNLLLPAAAPLLACCTPTGIGGALGAAMAALVLSYFGVTLGFFFAEHDRDSFEGTVIPAFFCAWFALCAGGLACSACLYAESGAMVLWRPRVDGHCYCCSPAPALPAEGGCCPCGGPTGYAPVGGGVFDSPDGLVRPRLLSMGSILAKSGACGVLRGYPLCHEARATLWAAALLAGYASARAVVTLLCALHTAGAITRHNAAMAGVYFGSEILMLLLVCQLLMPVVAGGVFDTSDAEFVLALFRNMRLRKNLVASVQDVFADVPKMQRTLSELPPADLERIAAKMQRNLQASVLQTINAVQAAQAAQAEQHAALVSSVRGALGAQYALTGDVLDAVSAQQEVLEDMRNEAELERGGDFAALPGPGGLTAQLLGAGGPAGAALAALGGLPPGFGGGGGGTGAASDDYKPPAQLAHSYDVRGALPLPTIDSPVLALQGSTASISSSLSRTSGEGGSSGGEGSGASSRSAPGTPGRLLRPAAAPAAAGGGAPYTPGEIGGVLADRGHPGSSGGIRLPSAHAEEVGEPEEAPTAAPAPGRGLYSASAAVRDDYVPTAAPLPGEPRAKPTPTSSPLLPARVGPAGVGPIVGDSKRGPRGV